MQSEQNHDAVREPAGSGGGRGERRHRNHVLLIIEDDPTFARIVSDLATRRAFKPIVAARGDVGLAMARQLRPDAILLDFRLPGLDGWNLLDHFKNDPSTRHIPVVIISGDDRRARALRRGAVGYLLKPVDQELLEVTLARLDALAAGGERRLLLVDADEAHRSEVLDLVSDGDVRVTAVNTGTEALAALAGSAFDCAVIARSLPDMKASELVRTISRTKALSDMPVIVRNEGASNSSPELRSLLETAAVREARSVEDLLDMTTLFLHRVEDQLSEPKRRLLEKLRRTHPVLAGRRVLIVDDDTRNVFALKSLLEAQKMIVLSAFGGRQCLEMLAREPAVDVILMDVMMPEMDGYQTIRAIRQVPTNASLPIFALTAKAMKGDRERCIEAGASDYIAKPVDTAQLLSLLRVWLGP